MGGAKLGRRLLLGLLLGFGLAAILVPLVNLPWFGESLRAGLERALDRRVELNGPTHVRLLPRPGFSLESVVIHEDPSIGLDPIAYVPSVDIDLRILALLRGEFAYSRLRLQRPSVNLVKSASDVWNYPALLERAFAGQGVPATPPPKIEVRGGRLNFTISGSKSVFYLSEADVDIEPVRDSEMDAIAFQFDVEPSRTDRPAQGFGKFTGNGQLTQPPGGESRIRMVVRLERSSIPEVLTLLYGQGAGLAGFAASRAELEGPISNVAVRGELELAELDRRLIRSSRSAEWALSYEGVLDIVGQRLRIDTRSNEPAAPPISVRLRVGDYLRSPSWAILATAEHLPLDGFPSLARELGLPWPSELTLSGQTSGALGWSTGDKLQGRFSLQEAGLATRDGAIARIPAAEVTLGDRSFETDAFTVGVGEDEARVTASYRHDEGQLRVSVETESFDIAGFRNAWSNIAGVGAPPALSHWRKGEWGGSLRCLHERGQPEKWSGRLAVKDAEALLPGLAEPVTLSSGESDANGSSWKFAGSAGKLLFSGSLASQSDPDWPLNLTLRLEDVAGSGLEKLFGPSLQWRSGGFLARTLGLRQAAMPPWLAQRRIQGKLEIAGLMAGPVRFDQLDGRFYWEGGLVRVIVDRAQAGKTSVAGRVRVNLLDGDPRYEVEADVRDLNWPGGLLGATGRLRSSGTSLKLVANARAEGEFAVQSSQLGLDSWPAGASGCFEFGYRQGLPTLSFPCLSLNVKDKEYYGRGTAGATGSLRLELFNKSGRYEAKGTLDPPRLELGSLSGDTLK